MMLIVQGIVFFIIYYVVFRLAIKWLKLSTPGRGDNLLPDPTSDEATTGDTAQDGDGTESTPSTSKYAQTASQILEGLGGKENITSLTNCATRLRMELNDNSVIDETKIKGAGAVGVTKSGEHNTQVIIGTHVQQVADEIETQMENNNS